MKTKLLYLFICVQFAVFAQTRGIPGFGKKCNSYPGTPNSVLHLASPPPLTATIATHYTMSACGLNYTQVSKPLFKRNFSPHPPNPSQPASYSVTGIPPCSNILKAFLYAGVLGSGTTVVTGTITNPANVTTSYPMTLVGGDGDLCWGYDGSFTYRADVTSAITGNGTYLISGIPVNANMQDDDAEGATLFIVYADLTKNYTGNIVIADGCQINTPTITSSQIYGFNVCGTPTLTEHFMLLADMQAGSDAAFSLNTALATPNFTVPMANQHVWNFESGPGAPAISGQTSAEYGIYTSGDCIGMMMAGMYYRSNCYTCTASGLNVSAVPSTTSCPATATVNVTGGGVAPYNYTWTPGLHTGSVVTLSNGNYTVEVSAQNGCFGSATVEISTPVPTINITKPSAICVGNTVKMVAGSAASYSWVPSTFLKATNSPTATLTPTVTGPLTYTLYFMNSAACNGSSVLNLTISACTDLSESGDLGEQLLIYPNPSSGNFTVESKIPMSLLLVNGLGQTIRTVELNSRNNNRSSVTGITEGVYYFVSKERSQAIKQKVVVGK